MPNNIVFNPVADQMKTQIYGTSAGSAVAIQTNASGQLIIGEGTITAMTQVTFTESSTTVASVSGTTATVMTQDTSQKKDYSFYVTNLTANTITAWLQISPTDVETYYMDDPSGSIAIGSSDQAVLAAQRFLRYTRIMLLGQDDPNTSSATVYYNAQG